MSNEKPRLSETGICKNCGILFTCERKHKRLGSCDSKVVPFVKAPRVTKDTKDHGLIYRMQRDEQRAREGTLV